MDSTDNNDDIIKRVLYTIKTLKEHPQVVAPEPIAIVGMACRFPGGCDTPEKFWQFLKIGKDAVSEIPADRFNVNEYYDSDPTAKGKMYTREGAFLQEDIASFDTRFFGISPKEAQDLDPQQRILLEMSWEAFERAGINPQRLVESKTGVFIGLILSDYASLPRNQESIGPYSITGTLGNLASGRISHYFGFHGPAITIDTACSSSLVGVHLACESLQNKECDMALAGGINIMLLPSVFVMLSKVNALAKDGRCKTFDESADGYGRGEGGGIVILKRLADAISDNDNILAVIKGSAVNQDGPSTGLTVPNGQAQQELIKEALIKAGINSEDVGYIEMHGTGTPLGDPIEFNAISEVYGKKNRKTPLYLGSVKPNIGHLEASAGIAAVIKSILCLQNKTLPPLPHLKKLNPRISLEKIPAIIPLQVVPWNFDDKPRIVGISSFGFSGTNSHVILSEPPAMQKKTFSSVEDQLQLLALSAKSKIGLKSLVEKYREYFQSHPDLELSEICYTANTGRNHFQNRIGFLVKDKQMLQEEMENFLRDKPHENFIFENELTPGFVPKVAFLFASEEGASFAKNALIYQRFRVFREALDACNKLFEPHFGLQSLPHLFSFEYALAQLLISWGVKPSAVFGGKMGAYVTACIAGVMSLQKAVECIVRDKNSGFILDSSDLSAPQISVISSRSGLLMKKSELRTPAYWLDQFSAAIEIDKAIESLHEQGYSMFVEIGAFNNNFFDNARKSFSKIEEKFISTTCEDDLLITLTRSVAKLYSLGVNIDWNEFYNHEKYNKIVLPTYPFQRKRYWIEPFKESEAPIIQNQEAMAGRLILSALPQKIIEYQISLDNLPELRDTSNIMHVGHYMEMVRSALKNIFKVDSFSLLNLEFVSALTFSEGIVKTLNLIFTSQSNDQIDLQIFSKDDQEQWTLHVHGKVQLNKKMVMPSLPSQSIAELKKLTSSFSFYDNLHDRGLDLGQSVSLINEVWSHANEAVARFKPIENEKLLPSGILDACAQLFHAAVPKNFAGNKIFMVSRWENFNVDYQESSIQELGCYVKVNESTPNAIQGAFYLFNTNNNKIIASCERCEMKPVDIKRMLSLKQAKMPTPAMSETDLIKKLNSVGKDEQQTLLINLIQNQLASLLAMPVEEISPNEPLRYLGLDSLVGMELKARLDADLGVDIPIDRLMQSTNIKELATDLIQFFSQDGTKKEKIQNQTYSFDKSLWMDVKEIPKTTKLKLFCFPYGGGGASLYKEWQNKLPAGITVIPIQLPGRENRIDEQPISDINEMISVLEKVLEPELTSPYAFYGHSAGALIAYRLAHKLRQNKEGLGKNLQHLFVAAYTSPLIYPNTWYQNCIAKFQQAGLAGIPNISELENCSYAQLEEFMTLLELNVNLSKYQNLKEDPVFLKLLLAKLLADLKLVESYLPNDKESLLDFPITAFHGEKDDRVTLDEIKAWQKLTTNVLNVRTLGGDHFFLHPDQQQVQLINMIVELLN